MFNLLDKDLKLAIISAKNENNSFLKNYKRKYENNIPTKNRISIRK